MSIQVMAAVFQCCDKSLTAPRRMILTVLANFASDDAECWPSQKRISQQGGCSERNVRDHLKWLEINGYIKRSTKRFGQGRGSKTSFRINLKKLKAGVQGSPKTSGEVFRPAKSAGEKEATFDGGIPPMGEHEPANSAGVNNELRPAESVTFDGGIPPVMNRQEPSIPSYEGIYLPENGISPDQEVFELKPTAETKSPKPPKPKSKSKFQAIPPQVVEMAIDLYRQSASRHGWPASNRRTSDARRKLISARLRECENDQDRLHEWKAALARAERSLFLTGRATGSTPMDLGWMSGPQNYEKILEGKYDDKSPARPNIDQRAARGPSGSQAIGESRAGSLTAHLMRIHGEAQA